jgi:hypothetical protein
MTYLLLRNAATDTIKQSLMFVGREDGKLLAVRQLIQQVWQYSGQVPPPPPQLSCHTYLSYAKEFCFRTTVGRRS